MEGGRQQREGWSGEGGVVGGSRGRGGVVGGWEAGGASGKTVSLACTARSAVEVHVALGVVTWVCVAVALVADGCPS